MRRVGRFSGSSVSGQKSASRELVYGPWADIREGSKEQPRLHTGLPTGSGIFLRNHLGNLPDQRGRSAETAGNPAAMFDQGDPPAATLVCRLVAPLHQVHEDLIHSTTHRGVLARTQAEHFLNEVREIQGVPLFAVEESRLF